MSYEEYFEAVKWYTLLSRKQGDAESAGVAETMHRYEWCVRRQYEVGTAVRQTSKILASVI